MRLSRVFQDGMVLQRNKPIFVWGTSEKTESIEVRICGKYIGQFKVSEGDFSFCIPAQGAAENVEITIGDAVLHNVDIGEVWLAGGQSNMEFALEFTSEWETEQAVADDEHLRVYTVGQYSFHGEREQGYKSWHTNWDNWLPYKKEFRADFTAAGCFFAKELRKSGVPVGIISCNWGGTSASAWLSTKELEADLDLKVYLDEFYALAKYLDNPKMNSIKDQIRKNMASKQALEGMKPMMKYTLSPEDFRKNIPQPDFLPGIDLSKVNPFKASNWGPGDSNAPAALWENMVKEVLGYSLQGIIWYQGESDDEKAGLYSKLFTALIKSWRENWQKKNPSQDRLPFLFAQLAPMGIWGMTSGAAYPKVRQQQELVSKSVPDVYMISTSDAGNIYDIHPKSKLQIGKRFALLAQKYIYGMNVVADAPEAETAKKDGNKIEITFKAAQNLTIKLEDFSSFNGFSAEKITNLFAPSIVDNVCGLGVNIDNADCKAVKCSVQENKLILESERFEKAKVIKIFFATTPFYQVNLYNEGGLPAKPFVFIIKE